MTTILRKGIQDCKDLWEKERVLDMEKHAPHLAQELEVSDRLDPNRLPYLAPWRAGRPKVDVKWGRKDKRLWFIVDAVFPDGERRHYLWRSRRHP